MCVSTADILKREKEKEKAIKKMKQFERRAKKRADNMRKGLLSLHRWEEQERAKLDKMTQ